MTTLDAKFQNWKVSQVNEIRIQTLDHYEKLLHSTPNGLPEKEILEQLTDEELFTLIVLRTHLYFKDFFEGFIELDGLPINKACVKRAMENAKAHFLKTKEEVIECFTKDWDTYNLI